MQLLSLHCNYFLIRLPQDFGGVWLKVYTCPQTNRICLNNATFGRVVLTDLPALSGKPIIFYVDVGVLDA